MTGKDLKILEDYCRVSQEYQKLEKEKNRLRGLINKMNLQPGFSLAILNGVLSVSRGNRKLMILDGMELVRELGNNFFVDNVTIPIGKLEATFKNGIVEKLVDDELIEIGYTQPFVRFQPGMEEKPANPR